MSSTPDTTRVESRIAEIARRLLLDVDRQERELSIGSSWEDQILDWSLSDPERKRRILQFIDVFPSLQSDRDILDHLKHFFPHDDHRLPLPLQTGLRWSGGLLTAGAISAAVRFLMKKMARRFIGGETAEEVAGTIIELASRKLTASVDFLGEATLSEKQADDNLETVLSTIRKLTDFSLRDKYIGQINLSIKCSALTSFFDPIDPVEVAARLLPRLRAILRLAAGRISVSDTGRRTFLHFDAEDYLVCDMTLDLLLNLFEEPEFRSVSDIGVVLQAYLRDADRRCLRIRDWCRQNDRPLTVRLVKGAYWDSEMIRAGRNNWTPPVYLRKLETDAAFERLTFSILAEPRMRLAVASHNLRSIAAALAAAESMPPPPGRLEFQFLFGMARATRAVLVGRGCPVRVYTPFGELIPGMAYLVRRLLENSSNESFLKIRRLGRIPPDELLRNPHESFPAPQIESVPPKAFENTSLPEFHLPEIRHGMRDAISRQLCRPAARISAVINGRIRPSDKMLTSVNPSHPSQIVAEVQVADMTMVRESVEIARKAFSRWGRTRAADRAVILRLVGERIFRLRFELAALEVCEAGKPWEEALADVAEAIDYFRYYSDQAIRLEEGQKLQPHVLGETNVIAHRPRGVAAVISPWNFPLAIPAGQTAAALAMGNCVLFKPAEQTPLIAYRLYEIYRDAGVPPDVLQFLPGVGEEIGPELVEHPGVDLIAFTGSRAVGEEILKRAASAPFSPSGPRRVIAEMGGKNAVIVDSDADLDLAVPECLRSAFDFAGQKCSALSRVILIESIFDDFVRRFVNAALHYPIGFAESPATRISPLIEESATGRIKRYWGIAESDGQWLLTPDPGRSPGEGFFVPPAVVALRNGSSRIAQEEIFGPLVAVLSAKNFEDALDLANATPFALTGGVFSRHPGHLALAKSSFDVGNLYLNRGVTGAAVARQPFGGHRSSGVGSKAGGPDYLAQFALPLTLSENLSRHGFSPDLSS